MAVVLGPPGPHTSNGRGAAEVRVRHRFTSWGRFKIRWGKKYVTAAWNGTAYIFWVSALGRIVCEDHPLLCSCGETQRHPAWPSTIKHHATEAKISDDASRLNLCIALVAAGRWGRYDGGGLHVALYFNVFLLSVVLYCIVWYNLYDMAVGGWGVADSKQPEDKQTPNLEAF